MKTVKESKNALSSMRKKLSLFTTLLHTTKQKIPHITSKKWTVLKTVRGLTIMKTSLTDTSIFAVRALHKIKSRTCKTPLEVMKHVMNFYIEPELKKKYLKVLHPYFPYYNSYHIEKEIYIVHCRFSSGTVFVKDRDYLNVRDLVEVEKDKECYFVSCSVPEEFVEKGWPRDKDCVRGHLSIYLIRIRKEDNGIISFEYLSHSDPKGMIPNWVTNWKAKEEALIVLRMYDVLKDWINTPEPEEKIEKNEDLNISFEEDVKNERELEIKIDEKTSNEITTNESNKFVEKLLFEKNKKINLFKRKLKLEKKENSKLKEDLKDLKNLLKKRLSIYAMFFVVLIQVFFYNKYTPYILLIEFFLKSFIFEEDFSILLFLYEKTDVTRLRFFICGFIIFFSFYDIRLVNTFSVLLLLSFFDTKILTKHIKKMFYFSTEEKLREE